ncbi:MAG: hypothetical protein WC028_25980 [Candidatus Obscuribacterales bacterium]
MNEASTQTWDKFIERLESGDIDKDIKEASTAAWRDVVGKVKLFSELMDCTIQSYTASSSSNTPSSSAAPNSQPKSKFVTELDAAYEALQTQLITVRMAVAQSIASEKQLDAQISKNREFVKTWADRATEAEEKAQSRLVEVARQRQEAYENAVAELEQLLENHKLENEELTLHRCELELTIQRAYAQIKLASSKEQASKAMAEADQIAADLLEKLKRHEE